MAETAAGQRLLPECSDLIAVGKAHGRHDHFEGRRRALDKTSMAVFDDGIPRLPKGTSPSTHCCGQIW